METGSAAVDDYYQILLAKGVVVSLYCKGMDTEQPEEYLNLPAGRSNNYASVFEHQGVPDGCHEWNPVRFYNQSGKTEFDKVRLDVGTTGIILDDFSFARKIGKNFINYGTAGDFFSSSKTCQPRGNFRVDLAGTPFIISQRIKWFWKGKFFDGSQNGEPILDVKMYVGCFTDKKERAMPAKLLRSSRMSVSLCQRHCSNGGFYYAGLESSGECWCGNDYKKYGPSKNCKSRCTGRKNEICGGPWALSVYVVGQPQYMTGRCGGYPGSCFPAQKYDNNTQLLILEITPKHPCYKSVCGPFAHCLAIDTMGYKCLCPSGFSGTNCEKRSEIVPTDGRCPPKYQAEVCRCQAADCFGARFINGVCKTIGGKPQIVCRYGDPSHVSIVTVTSGSYPSVRCPYNTKIVSCSYWDPHKKLKGNGQIDLSKVRYHMCTNHKCRGCSVQAKCMKYFCGCKNGGKCDLTTQECRCRPGFTGELCEDYDYCSFWETTHKRASCGRRGICRSIPQLVVSTIGGDQAGDRCLFPFNYQGHTFSRCVNDNRVGPPFACATDLNGRSSYIDLGNWGPGPAYSILAWVKPTLKDSRNRLIVGSISNCRDFGLAFQFGRFQTFYASRRKDFCTIPISTYDFHSELNKWHAVAVMNTGKYITLMVNGRIWATHPTYSNFLGNVDGFHIGGGPYNSAAGFKGAIKNVKIYNRALNSREVDKIFENNSVEDSVAEVKRGLVGHYELGEKLPEKCHGIDHGFQDWIPADRSEISGVHCNISRFMIKRGMKVFVSRWNGASNGSLELTANEIVIDGELNAEGAGYHGGKPSEGNGADGTQGESHSDAGGSDVNSNRGGGGGGLGETSSSGGGLPGGGGGYGTIGKPGTAKIAKTGNGVGGAMYGSQQLHYMYLGSGGGSGGNARDLTETPKGGAGGNGGGAVKLFADTRLIITGTISVQGSDGLGDPIGPCIHCPATCKAHGSICTSNSRTNCWDKSGPGGGGSGGSIYLSGEYVDIGINRLFATGGNGGRGANMCGGDGGTGRIYILSSSLIGRLDSKFGLMRRSTRQDKIKDFSHLGHTVGNEEIQINKNPVYLGCIQEKKDFLLKHKLTLNRLQAKRLTPLSCHQLCTKAGHIYSGTTKGSQCYCDDHVTTTAHRPDVECGTPCPGDKRQLCGGDSRVIVFGPRPNSYGRRVTGAPIKCESWCVTAGRDAKKPKWGRCVDESDTLSMTLACECPKGKIGEECDQDCPVGSYGLACRNNCSCNGHPCDPFNGNCKCPKEFWGGNCERKRCPPGRMGDDCDRCVYHNRWGKDCTPCDCGKGRCHFLTGKCSCPQGFTGPKCSQVCPENKYGRDCSSRCSCKNGASCEPVFGMCNCGPGYVGRKCDERCPQGTFGPRCSSNCPVCSTDTCHHVTGKCICDSGFQGENCTEVCPSGTWGVACANECGFNCDNGCNPIDGSCCLVSCLTGYCDGNGTCIGEIVVENGWKWTNVKSNLKSASLGAGGIVGVILVLLLLTLSAVLVYMYFFRNKKIFTFAVANYKTQKDDVVVEGHFANPFYETSNTPNQPSTSTPGDVQKNAASATEEEHT